MKHKAKIRERIHQKYCGHCAYCGEEVSLKAMQIDHVVPRSMFERHKELNLFPEFVLKEGGVDHSSNLFPSCGSCNKWKSDKDLEFFRAEIQAQSQRLRKYSSSFRLAVRFGLIRETPISVKFHFEEMEEIYRVIDSTNPIGQNVA